MPTANRDAAVLNGNEFLIGPSSFTVLLRQQPELFGGGDETEVALLTMIASPQTA